MGSAKPHQDAENPRDASLNKMRSSLAKLEVPLLLEDQRFALSEGKERALFVAELMAHLKRADAHRLEDQDAAVDIHAHIRRRILEARERDYEMAERAFKAPSLNTPLGEVDALFASIEKAERRRLSDQRVALRSKS